MHVWRHTQWTGTNSQPLDRTIPSPVTLRLEEIATRTTHVDKDTVHAGAPAADACRLASKRLAGDHAQVETPVPIPNTADKHLGPMVVRPARE